MILINAHHQCGIVLCLITEGNDLEDLIDDNVEGEEEEEEEEGEQKEKKKKKRKRSELVLDSKLGDPHQSATNVVVQPLAAFEPQYSHVVCII